MFGVKAVIAMPADAPAMKIDNVREMGAEVVPFDRFGDDRMTVVAPYMDDRGMVLVPPFDDPAIIAGQGTIGLELLRQAKALGVTSTPSSFPVAAVACRAAFRSPSRTPRRLRQCGRWSPSISTTPAAR